MLGKDYLKETMEIEDLLVDSVNSAELMRHTKEIAKWVRVSGTKDELDSLRYIADQLEEYGYTTKLTFHAGFISVPVRASVEVQSPERMAFEAITHSFGVSTPVCGLTGEIVEGNSTNIMGKIVLLHGLPSAAEVLNMQNEGAKAIIFVQDEHLHNYAVSILWGSPVEQTEHLLPQIPVVSVCRKDGIVLEEFIRKGKTRVRIEAVVDTGWRDVPLLEAEIKAPNSDKFVLFSSHIDSWDYGAMDNGAANATALEVARLMASQKERWLRGLRLVFWSGHSQGKFFSSAWYADNHWEELIEKCVGHVYVDSTGGKDAVVITEAPVMPQTKKLAADIIKKQTGETFIGKRIGHFADQSFYGVGLTSIFGTFSEQDASKDKNVISFKTGSPGGRAGGLGWWWHTCHDTIDKIDEQILLRDTRVYVATLWRLLTSPLLPYDFRDLVDEMIKTATTLQAELKERFDLQPLFLRLDSLKNVLESFYNEIEGLVEPGDKAEEANEKLMKLSHQLVRATFLEKDCFDFDFSGPMFPIPPLTKGLALAKVPMNSYRYHVLRTEFQRGYNRVMHYLREAMGIIA